MQNTKVVWTLEAKSLKKYEPQKLIHYPWQALRIIYDKAFAKEILAFIKTCKEELKKLPPSAYKPILIDVSHRAQAKLTGLLAPVSLEGVSSISFVPKGEKGGTQLSCENWGELFKEGELAYLHSGDIILSVDLVEEKKVICSVLQGKELRDKMELAVPATRKLPSIFNLAFIDIKAFLKLGVDYVILPGISSARELAIIKKKLSTQTEPCPELLLKVDSLSVCRSIKETLPLVSGLMISRRALALSTDPASVPTLSKEIIHKANQEAKITLVSSEMLYSMHKNPTPTRAEVSDIANAVIDGTDAVVLSKEISSGHYSLRALNVAASAIEEAEQSVELKPNWQKGNLEITNKLGSLAYYAYVTSKRVQAKALVCLTKEGRTARQIASYRPKIPIIAFTFNERTKAKISLIRGVSSIVLEGEPVLDKVLPTIQEHLKKSGVLCQGERFVFVTLSLSPLSGEASNLFTIQEAS